MRYWLLGGLVGLIALYALVCVALYGLMLQPPVAFAQTMGKLPWPVLAALPFETLWRSARAGALKPGQAAPEFDLPILDSQERVRLLSFRGERPVVLVFGSYT
jgi:hypothetical protein